LAPYEKFAFGGGGRSLHEEEFEKLLALQFKCELHGIKSPMKVESQQNISGTYFLQYYFML